MQYAFKRALAKRGSVFFLPSVKFSNNSTPKPKYCILMEDYIGSKENLIVIFTTSRLEFSHRKSSVLVKGGIIKGIEGDTLIECHNWRLLPSESILENDRVKYLCRLPENIMGDIEEALTYVRNIDESILIRMMK